MAKTAKTKPRSERAENLEGSSLQDLGEVLRSIGVSPEEVLRSAIEGEIAIGRLSGSIRPDDPASRDRRLEALGIRRDPADRRFSVPGRRLPWDALRSFPHAIFSPTVAALVWYAKGAAMPRWSTDEADETPKRGMNYEDTTPALHFLKQIGTALLPPLKGHPMWRREAVLEVLRLAWKHDALADELSERYPTDSARRAWEGLAKEEHVTPAALRQRVTRAKREAPSEPWPRKRARRF